MCDDLVGDGDADDNGGEENFAFASRCATLSFNFNRINKDPLVHIEIDCICDCVWVFFTYKY